MPRLQPAEPHGLDLFRRLTFRSAKRTYRRPMEPIRVLAHHRKLLFGDSAQFDELERLVLEYAEAMTRTPVAVTDELFAQLREHFDERQMVELTMAIALENLYGRSNWAFGLEGEGFSEGMYCVRPQAAAQTLEAA
jgi:hypothetical protein